MKASKVAGICLLPKVEPDSTWAQEEFGRVELGDRRLTRRLVGAVGAMMQSPGQSIPELSGNWAGCKGLYRLLKQPGFDEALILEAHRAGSLRRVAEAGPETLLAIQDTTTLNFSSHGKLAGQGPIGNKAKTTGLHLHNTLLVGAADGEIYGLLGAKLYAREPGKRQEQAPGTRNREAIEEKESYRWMESFEMARAAHGELSQASAQTGKTGPRVVSVGDREADIYELLAEASGHSQAGLYLLVRSQHNRAVLNEEPGACGSRAGSASPARWWEQLATGPEAGRVKVQVPRKQGMRSRTAELAIRHRSLLMDVPAHKRKYLGLNQAVQLNLIELRESAQSAPGTAPIHWRLVTTLPVQDVEQAAGIARFYALRWQVEVLHRVLKTGCRVEDRQLRTMDRLRPMIALDLVVATYLMSLASAARIRPQAGACKWLEPNEITALQSYHRLVPSAAGPLCLGRAVQLIAGLGGHLGRKSDGSPGAEVLWRGLQKLQTITEAWLIFSPPNTYG